jgi:hypothetical protein
MLPSQATGLNNSKLGYDNRLFQDKRYTLSNSAHPEKLSSKRSGEAPAIGGEAKDSVKFSV